MATIPIPCYAVEEINYFLSYFTTHIAEYKLSELTSGYMGDIPSINNCHPLALEYGNMMNADNEGNYTSLLPAIGIELINDNEAPQQFLGTGQVSEEITQAKLDSWSAVLEKNRWLNGVMLAASNLISLIAMKATKGLEKLWCKRSSYMQDVQLAISIWSDHFEITRRLYLVVRDMLNRIKKDISTIGVKNLKIQGQGAIYNFEFHTTLFGAEFTVSFLNTHYQVEVDSSLTTIKSVEESYISPFEESKPIFKGREE